MKDIMIYIIFAVMVMFMVYRQPHQLELKIEALESQLNTIQLVLMREPVEIKPKHLMTDIRLKDKD